MKSTHLLVLATIAAVAGCSGESPQQVLGTVERDRLELVAESNERIVEIAVREGDRVAAGALLVRQEAGTAQARIDQAKAAQAETERRLADLVAGPRRREVDEARATLAGAESALQTDVAEYTRVRSLVERKLLSASELDRARARRDNSVAARDAARAQLDLLRQGTRTEQIAEARAAVARTRAALAEVQTVADRYTVRAPRAATVEALPYELGERPTPGRPVAILLGDGAPYARVYVPEPLRGRVRAGTKVELTVDGEPRRYTGTVRYVSAEAAFTPYYALTQKDRSRLAYVAEIDLVDAAAARLPTGLPVQVLVPGAR
ncbi:MAG TPA: HlyD family efflux transporter periplasmic adaptor subunit [Steroidobacteraceae bacterium]|nr:HlyD family efflux transporter periplasmic adaptor subunit [Steroidobacteraceae bacterium]